MSKFSNIQVYKGTNNIQIISLNIIYKFKINYKNSFFFSMHNSFQFHTFFIRFIIDIYFLNLLSQVENYIKKIIIVYSIYYIV